MKKLRIVEIIIEPNTKNEERIKILATKIRPDGSYALLTDDKRIIKIYNK